MFAACDRLDAANERWNREDVRNEVAGGGYVVIDPLSCAWRSLNPLREVAPNTPSELLKQQGEERARSAEKHASALAAQLEVSSELQAGLEDQKAQAVSIEREFSAYKEEHKLSGNLGALQEAVAVLQDQLREKKNKKKE